MENLSRQRCFNHGVREAAACCPACGRFYCRECVTEHEGRVLCATCIQNSVVSTKTRKRTFEPVVQMVLFVCGVFILWMFFYHIGQLLLQLPTAFHEGTLWQTRWWEGF